MYVTMVLALILFMLYISSSTLYQLILAAVYFIKPERKKTPAKNNNKFAIIVPAHNEELLIRNLCESLAAIDYPNELYQTFIIVDNCSDNTANICRSFPVNTLERNNAFLTGKGHAINWALNEIDINQFDAVLIVDADNFVDPGIISELNILIDRGEQAIQCHNAVGNKNDSWFTQLLNVSRTIGNLLYHHSKYKLGLSSYLMGNGICFSTELLRKKQWQAFSIGEDWEYYAQLIDDGIKIGFAVDAKVFHQESKSLAQATTQRLRWSSGRFQVVKKYGLRLFIDGLMKHDFFKMDASLPLIFPNYSLQLNLTVLFIILSKLFTKSMVKRVLVILGLFLVAGQMLLFLSGVYLTKNYKKVFKSVCYAPFFLAWKAIIDFLSFTGLYKSEKWIRTKRHIST